MKAYILLFGLFCFLVHPLFAQKNVVPVTKSSFTGIQLPSGSKEDKRILSTAAAAMVLEEEAKASGVKIATAEVLQLPVVQASGWGRKEFEGAVRLAGWLIFPVQNNPAYGWLKRSDAFIFYYYSELNARTDLYFGKPDGVPVLSVSDNPSIADTKPTGTIDQIHVNESSKENSKNTASKGNLPPVQNKNTQTRSSLASSITGTWYKSNATRGNTTYGYTKCQYVFRTDGTYIFYRKTFDVYTPQLILRKESGTYATTDRTLTINPVSAVVQTWSKKDGADQWGNLIKTETVAMEKSTYTIAYKTFGEILNLLLSPDTGQQTNRDGVFGSNSEFPNTYFYERPPDSSYLIALPAGESFPISTLEHQEKQQPIESASFNGKYTYSVTNWDNGWVSTIENNKVVVTKGNIRVHVYFPLAYDDASRNAGRDYYWDTHLTKEFRILSKQYRDHGEMISSFQAPYIEGTAVDPKTGKNCFIAFYVNSHNGMMFPFLAIAPDEQSIRQTFPNAEKQYESDLGAMDRYNRFAVALPDLVGKWTGGGSAAMNYYNAYTGSYAGMAAVAMSDAFEFFENGEYTSKHQGASGMVGAMSTYSQNYKGNATFSNWEIVLPNRWEGKSSTFHAWFEAVQGGRVLHLQDKQSSGMKYSLVRE